MAHLELHGVSIALGRRDVSAQVDAGELVVVVGPNGAGKTTLLRAIGGLVAPRAGTIRVVGRDPLRAPRRDIARELAYLSQHYELAFPFAVEEVVLLGPDHRLLVPASMFGGAAVLTVSDTLARTVVPLHHLLTGAVTSVLGVRFFLASLVGQKQRAALWGRG